MRKNRSVCARACLLALFAAAIAATGASAQEETNLLVQRGGKPASNVEVVVSTQSGREAAGSTGPSGTLPFPASLLTGKLQAEAFVQECENGSTTLILVPDGAELNAEDDECRREDDAGEVSCGCRRLGVFYWPFTDGIGIGGTAFPWKPVALGGGAAGAALVILSGGGESSTTPPSTPSVIVTTISDPTPTPATTYDPNGSYPSTIVVLTDPGGHTCCIFMPGNMVLLITVNGDSISITGMSPFVPVMGPYQHPLRAMGTFNARTGRFNATGAGTVAGFSNIGVSFEGTIQETGELNGVYRMGVNGGLPGGQAIAYEINGKKQ